MLLDCLGTIGNDPNCWWTQTHSHQDNTVAEVSLCNFCYFIFAGHVELFLMESGCKKGVRIVDVGMECYIASLTSSMVTVVSLFIQLDLLWATLLLCKGFKCCLKTSYHTYKHKYF